MNKVKEFFFDCHSEADGRLSVAEVHGNIPFEIKRVFWIDKVTRTDIRGNHASRNCEFAYICIRGSVCIETDDGFVKKIHKLSDKNPNGLHLLPGVWIKAFNFSDDAILLVFASEGYTKNIYYENYECFSKEMSENGQKKYLCY